MPYGGSKIRTLVVDDSEDYGLYLCAFLDTQSQIAVIAKGRNGREAVALAHEWRPDLVMMDVRMPEMTGPEAASQLAKELPDLVVILMSAFEDEEVWRASKKSGAYAFVLKEELTQDLPLLLELAAAEKGWDKPSKNCA
jgi:NarL family two-component system response regulator LiaR